MSQYYVSHENKQLGPFDLDQIVEKIRGKEFDLFDYISDGQSDWVLLAEHMELKEKMSAHKPTHLPKAEEATQITPVATGAPGTEWFVLKGEHRFGPFSYREMIRMLQQKTIFGFDFTWNSTLTSWKRIAEMAEFQETMVRHLLKTQTDADWSEAFLKRQHPRRAYTAEIVLHDNRSCWKGKAKEISIGGVGLTMENSLIVPGQQIFAHFKAADDFPAFNATGEVVSKKFRDGVKDHSMPIEYGLRFLSLSGGSKEQLAETLKRQAA